MNNCNSTPVGVIRKNIKPGTRVTLFDQDTFDDDQIGRSFIVTKPTKGVWHYEGSGSSYDLSIGVS